MRISDWSSVVCSSDLPNAVEPLRTLKADGAFTDLEAWGDTTLGIVTGNNHYFTLSPERVNRLGLQERELLRLSPPGSAHLRGLTLTSRQLSKLGRDGRARPEEHTSELQSLMRTS